MSRYHGKFRKGAARALRVVKREEGEARQANTLCENTRAWREGRHSRSWHNKRGCWRSEAVRDRGGES